MDIQTEIKNFNLRLQKLAEALTVVKSTGINEDILAAYLCHKLKISEKKAYQIMEAYEAFYQQTLNNYMFKSLKTNDNESNRQ